MKLAALALTGLALVACSSTVGTYSPAPSPATTPAPTGQVAVQWPAPDDHLTPGAVTPGCTYPRPKSQRDVTAATKRRVEAEYGYTGPTDIGHIEIDHRVPFFLCGSNEPENLWVEPYDGVRQSTYVHNYKDQLESVIARRVEHHLMSLHDAQQVFYGDWRLAWCRYVHKTGVIC